MDFASDFHVKEARTENDTEILEIIMHEGDDYIWSCCALAMLRHPDRFRGRPRFDRTWRRIGA